LEKEIHPNLLRKNIEAVKREVAQTINFRREPRIPSMKSSKSIIKYIRNNNKPILDVLLSQHAPPDNTLHRNKFRRASHSVQTQNKVLA
jgi:hypothetical protein